MRLPIIIVNFKLYENAVGDNALKLARTHEKVAQETGASIAIAVNALDVVRVAAEVSIPVFAQHFDPVGYGSHTGHIHPAVLKAAGVSGSLLNHAEHQLSDDVLVASIHLAKECGLYTVVCADTPMKGAKIAVEMGPDLVAVEPPELIGGDISVSRAQADIVKKAVELIGVGRTLVGAGIKDMEDVRLSLEFGASGVLLASGVTKAEDPYAVLMDLVRGLGA